MVNQYAGQTARYTKAQLLSFQRYRARRDLLTAILKDGETYTIREADAAMKRFFAKRK